MTLLYFVNALAIAVAVWARWARRDSIFVGADAEPAQPPRRRTNQ